MAPAAAAPPRGIPAELLAARIDSFLALRGYKTAAAATSQPPASSLADRAAGAAEGPSQVPVDFVCEDDVRTAIAAGRTVLIGEKTIITPAARELGEARKVFVQAGWPR